MALKRWHGGARLGGAMQTLEFLRKKNEDRIKRLKKFSRVINPLFCIGFVIVFWAAGMEHYYQEL